MANFSKTRRFNLERLEDRQLMAGDVTAFFNGGTLFIQEAVGSIGGEQNIEIILLAPNKVPLMGATSPGNSGGTKINGTLSAPVFEFAPGAKIDVQLGAGNDSVRVFGKTGQTLLASININTSNSSDPAVDNDFVRISNVAIGQFVSITAGSGADVVQVNNATTSALTIRAGISTPGRPDADQVSVVNATVLGNLLVTTGEGNDAVTVKSVNLPASNVGRHLTIDAGAGADAVKVGSNLLGTPNPDLTPVSVSGVVHIIAGRDAEADADVVQMQDVFTDSFLTVELGGGNDQLDLFHSTAGKAISLAGQKGDDTVNVREVETRDGYYAFLGEGSYTLSIINLKATIKAELNGGDGDGFDRLFFSQSPHLPTVIRSAFEEINGQKLISKDVDSIGHDYGDALGRVPPRAIESCRAGTRPVLGGRQRLARPPGASLAQASTISSRSAALSAPLDSRPLLLRQEWLPICQWRRVNGTIATTALPFRAGH